MIINFDELRLLIGLFDILQVWGLSDRIRFVVFVDLSSLIELRLNRLCTVGTEEVIRFQLNVFLVFCDLGTIYFFNIRTLFPLL